MVIASKAPASPVWPRPLRSVACRLIALIFVNGVGVIVGIDRSNRARDELHGNVVATVPITCEGVRRDPRTSSAARRAALRRDHAAGTTTMGCRDRRTRWTPYSGRGGGRRWCGGGRRSAPANARQRPAASTRDPGLPATCGRTRDVRPLICPGRIPDLDRRLALLGVRVVDVVLDRFQRIDRGRGVSNSASSSRGIRRSSSEQSSAKSLISALQITCRRAEADRSPDVLAQRLGRRRRIRPGPAARRLPLRDLVKARPENHHVAPQPVFFAGGTLALRHGAMGAIDRGVAVEVSFRPRGAGRSSSRALP